MESKWNRIFGRINWIFYRLMSVLIPGGLILHFFGLPYRGGLGLFSLLMMAFAEGRRRSIKPGEFVLWLATGGLVILFALPVTSVIQGFMIVLYGLWILNGPPLETYLIPGAFGKSFVTSLGMIGLAAMATSMVGWRETAVFIRWAIPVYLLSAALMMVRINLMMAYRQRDGHAINREKNLLLFNGISLVFFAAGGFFLFSAWLPPVWTAGLFEFAARAIGWILYPLALVLAKGSQALKGLILLIRPDGAGESAQIEYGENPVEFQSQETMAPFMDWAGWLILILLFGILLYRALKFRRGGDRQDRQGLPVEEKHFMHWDEIFPRRESLHAEKAEEDLVTSRYRRLFGQWVWQLDRREPFLRPATTPNQLVDKGEALGISPDQAGQIVDTYNRVRYRGDAATRMEEEKLENAVRHLEEKANIQ